VIAYLFSKHFGIKVYERQTRPILQYYREKKVKLIEFKTESLDMPRETAVENITKELKKLKLAYS
jgi:adenylate kinase family enzyme